MTTATTTQNLTDLRVATIVANPGQPRQLFEGIEALASSINENGLLQPIVVRHMSDHYQIIAGERRFRAVQSLGWEYIPAIVVQADDEKTFTLAVLENVGRKDMTPLEEATAYQKLADLGWDFAKIEKQLGVGNGFGIHVARMCSLLQCIPEVQHLIDRRHLTAHQGITMAKLSRNGQLAVLRALGEKKLSQVELAALCDRIHAGENQIGLPVDLPPEVTKEARARSKKVATALTRIMEGTDEVAAVLDEGVVWVEDDIKSAIDQAVLTLSRLRTRILEQNGHQIAASIGK